MDALGQPFSRRRFLLQTSHLATAYAASRLLPASVRAQSAPRDPRIAESLLIDKGFAAVRRIGTGVYATVSDRTKGLQTRSNGGFIVGRDSALLIESFQTPAGAAFQVEALRMVSQVPILAAINTHFHHDHSLGGTYYGANKIPLWAHAKVPQRMREIYSRIQATDSATFLAPWQGRVRDAKTDLQRRHAQSDIAAVTGMVEWLSQYALALPNHPLDPAQMPMKVDLGGSSVVIETHPGHTDTDLIIRVPDQNVVFTGDLLVNAQYPTNINGDPTPWRATLAQFASFDNDTIFVPGHGSYCGREGVALLRDVFDDIAAQSEKLFKAGVPLEDAIERYVVPDPWKSFGMLSWGFCIGRTLAQLYTEWGKPSTPLSY